MKKPKPCITPAARVFYISLVFSNVRRVLSQFNTRLRLLYLLNVYIYIYIYIYNRTQMKRWHNFSLRLYFGRTNRPSSGRLKTVTPCLEKPSTQHLMFLWLIYIYENREYSVTCWLRRVKPSISSAQWPLNKVNAEICPVKRIHILINGWDYYLSCNFIYIYIYI